MARYRVKTGHVLPQNGQVLAAGTVVELTDDQANDIAISYRVEPADLEPASVPSAGDIVAEEIATRQGADRPTQE